MLDKRMPFFIELKGQFSTIRVSDKICGIVFIQAIIMNVRGIKGAIFQVSKIDKQKERWNRLKSKGKKRYVLKFLFFYVVFALILTTLNMFVLNRPVIIYIPYVFSIYIMSIVIFSLLGIWVGKRAWNANIKKFEN